MHAFQQTAAFAPACHRLISSGRGARHYVIDAVCLIDFRIDDRRIQAILTLFEILHDRYDRVGPLPPHGKPAYPPAGPDCDCRT